MIVVAVDTAQRPHGDRNSEDMTCLCFQQIDSQSFSFTNLKGLTSTPHPHVKLKGGVQGHAVPILPALPHEMLESGGSHQPKELKERTHTMNQEDKFSIK